LQADELRVLQEELHATQEMLKREEHRVQLLEAELLRLRCSQSACLQRLPPTAAGAAAAVAGGMAAANAAAASDTGSATATSPSSSADVAPQLLVGGSLTGHLRLDELASSSAVDDGTLSECNRRCSSATLGTAFSMCSHCPECLYCALC
jgi:hypothetical protein